MSKYCQSRENFLEQEATCQQIDWIRMKVVFQASSCTSAHIICTHTCIHTHMKIRTDRLFTIMLWQEHNVKNVKKLRICLFSFSTTTVTARLRIIAMEKWNWQRQLPGLFVVLLPMWVFVAWDFGDASPTTIYIGQLCVHGYSWIYKVSHYVEDLSCIY